MNRWNDLVALAGEIDAASRAGGSIAPDDARLLAQMVLAMDHPPAAKEPQAAAARERGPK